MKILVLCPSRGRPAAAQETLDAFLATNPGPDTSLLFVVDEDDQTLDRYPGFAFLVSPPPGSMVAALNAAAMAKVDDYDVIGFIGDDHRFRTPGWDLLIAEVFTKYGSGIAFGDDLAQRANLPTQVFISSGIIKALGYMALPTCRHLYVDNAWRTLGEALGALFYIPSIVIEHLHPAYGKGEWDAGHLLVNSQEMYNHDRLAYETWCSEGLARDLERIAVHA